MTISKSSNEGFYQCLLGREDEVSAEAVIVDESSESISRLFAPPPPKATTSLPDDVVEKRISGMLTNHSKIVRIIKCHCNNRQCYLDKMLSRFQRIMFLGWVFLCSFTELFLYDHLFLKSFQRHKWPQTKMSTTSDPVFIDLN